MKNSLKNKISSAREQLKKENIDCWVVYQFMDQNPFFNELTNNKDVVTRRAVLIIPTKGAPKLIRSEVDSGLSKIPVDQISYRSYESFCNELKDGLKGYKKIAMEYSVKNQIPHISKIDAGIAELIRSFEHELVSSGNILQLVLSLNNKQIASHIEAAKKLDGIREETFEFLQKQIKNKQKITEFSIQELIMKKINDLEMETISRPTVSFDENSATGHYIPEKDKSKTLKGDDVILIDIWARSNHDNSIYADMTWMLYNGTRPPKKYQEIFDLVLKARERAVSYLKENISAGNEIYGWEVDKVARDVITKEGYGEYFRHRLGHSLGTFVHGDLVHFDNYENRDTRQILNNHVGTIEPGIYIPGEFGVRSEINIAIQNNKVAVTTEEQDKIYCLV